jgi:preprotein translocase subunit SecE
MASIVDSWTRLTSFFAETRSEMKKVTFPSRKEVMATTAVVLIASVIFSLFLALSDIVILQIYKGIQELLGG